MIRQFNGDPDRLDTGLDQSKGATDSVSMYCWFKQDTTTDVQTLFGRNNLFSGDDRLQFRTQMNNVGGNWDLLLDMWGAGNPHRRFCTIPLPGSTLGQCIFGAYVNDVTNNRARFYWGLTTDTIVEVDVAYFQIAGNFCPITSAQYQLGNGSPGVYINIGANGRESGGYQENFVGVINSVGIVFDTELTLAQLKDRSRSDYVNTDIYYWPITGTDPEPGIVTIYGTTVVDELQCGFVEPPVEPPPVPVQPPQLMTCI